MYDKNTQKIIKNYSASSAQPNVSAESYIFVFFITQKLIPTGSAYSSPQSPKAPPLSRLPYPPSKRTLSDSVFGATQYIYYP
ncbi:hypothetical protein B9Z55_028537 [Caenorhabditis nigoni]|nr:hypothetical protein B9Z55_028537 [Caenorhabditis nigoni]